jgi:hypothetical protein
MFDANRRKYPRVNYPCQLTIWLFDGFNKTILAQTSNIGLGGVCVHLNEAFDVGTKVDIQLQFPGTTTPFRCHGKIVRCMPAEKGLHNIGIQFDPLSELKHAFLDGKISDIIALEPKGEG